MHIALAFSTILLHTTKSPKRAAELKNEKKKREEGTVSPRNFSLRFNGQGASWYVLVLWFADNLKRWSARDRYFRPVRKRIFFLGAGARETARPRKVEIV